jgi:hypothetical protein
LDVKKTYTGSCHCGQVRFECELDLSQGTSRCNCSICSKSRFWKAIVKSDAFRLIEGEKALKEYQFGSHNIHHFFCGQCGVRTFGRGRLEELGEFYAVNVTCLDEVTPKELDAAPIRYEDGRNNNWAKAPSEWRYL